MCELGNFNGSSNFLFCIISEISMLPVNFPVCINWEFSMLPVNFILSDRVFGLITRKRVQSLSSLKRQMQNWSTKNALVVLAFQLIRNYASRDRLIFVVFVWNTSFILHRSILIGCQHGLTSKVKSISLFQQNYLT